jgi:hypothetical protein
MITLITFQNSHGFRPSDALKMIIGVNMIFDLEARTSRRPPTARDPQAEKNA